MAAHPVDIHVGKKLRSQRERIGLSQGDLANSVGITFQQIQKYEKGFNRIGSSRLYEIAKVMAVSIEYFFEGLSGGSTSDAGFAEDSDAFQTHPNNDKETRALIRAYYKIDDPTVRKKVLALIKTMNIG